jgi:phosphoribosylamine---glycine ligase
LIFCFLLEENKVMKEKKNKILVIGSGGRDNAIAYLFSKSPRASEVYIAPGNGGSELFAKRVAIKSEDFEALISFAKEKKIDLTFVGPESPLSLGIVDFFKKHDLPIIGPDKKASRLEGSKCDTKVILKNLDIPVPEFAIFNKAEEAKKYVANLDYQVVVKADGLAAGKGSLVCNDKTEADEAIEKIMVGKAFGEAGNRLIIEERLFGRELSFFCFTDGQTVLPMETAQDYKRALDNDEGKNTGGMGSYSPHPWLTEDLEKVIMEKVALPIIAGIKKKYNMDYKGIIYFGLMLVEERGSVMPYVLEINVRLGDPEAQAVLPRLKTDLIDVCESILESKLSKIRLEWEKNVCLCLCAVSGRTKGKKGWYKGYPDRYKIGLPISGLESISQDCLVFHSGTEKDSFGNLITSGGRVLSVVNKSPTLFEARKKAYQEMAKINFDGIHYRKDIGTK